MAFFNAFFSFFMIGIPEETEVAWGDGFWGVVADDGSSAGDFFFFFFYLVVLEMQKNL